MFGISDFVRNTLAYVSNCGVAFVTLLVSACRLRPVRGAIRCKVRQDTQAAEVPDSRVMLFIAACLLAFDLTYAFSGTASMLTAIAGAVTGAHRAADSTIVTAVALYFACEWSISGATSRRALTGRRGRRNRQILRFLVAALLIQVAVYGPLAMWLLALGVNVSWATMSGRPPSFLGTLVDDALFIVRLAIAFAPFVFLGVFLSQAKAFRLSANTPRILAALPMTLIVTALAASFVTWILYPPRTPKIVAIRCTARPGGSNDVVVVDATFVNEGDQWWRPRQLLMLDVLGEERTNPVTGETSDYQTGGMTLAFNEDPDPLIVPPHGRINLHREVPLDKGSVKGATGCALTNGTPTSSPDFYNIFFSESDAWASEIDWDAIEPANHLKGRFIQPETDIRVAPLENTGGPENAN